MLGDLTRDDWLDLLQLSEELVPNVVILRGTRNFRVHHDAMARNFRGVVEVGSPNGLIEDVFVGERAGRYIGFACVYGAPMASEIVHIFGVLGTKVVLQIGNCGAIADGLSAGDLFLAEHAWCGEGAAQYYNADGKWVAASPEMVEAAQACLSWPYTTGAIYTTSALFAERGADIERWHGQGFGAVDLETAATYAVAEHFGMRRLSMLYVFDNPRKREHLLLSDREKDARRQQANLEMIRLALELAEMAAS
jgi:purine-nucleoside phosphorylase